MTISGNTFLTALPGKGGVPFASDQTKTQATWKDMLKMERGYMNFLWDADQYLYDADSRDCDWFACQYIAYMDRVSSNMGVPSFAVAEVWYQPELSRSLHSAAVWMLDTGKLHWRETQPKCKRIRPTLQERRSVCFRRV